MWEAYARKKKALVTTLTMKHLLPFDLCFPYYLHTTNNKLPDLKSLECNNSTSPSPNKLMFKTLNNVNTCQIFVPPPHKLFALCSLSAGPSRTLWVIKNFHPPPTCSLHFALIQLMPKNSTWRGKSKVQRVCGVWAKNCSSSQASYSATAVYLFEIINADVCGLVWVCDMCGTGKIDEDDIRMWKVGTDKKIDHQGFIWSSRGAWASTCNMSMLFLCHNRGQRSCYWL